MSFPLEYRLCTVTFFPNLWQTCYYLPRVEICYFSDVVIGSGCSCYEVTTHREAWDLTKLFFLFFFFFFLWRDREWGWGSEFFFFFVLSFCFYFIIKTNGSKVLTEKARDGGGVIFCVEKPKKVDTSKAAFFPLLFFCAPHLNTRRVFCITVEFEAFFAALCFPSNCPPNNGFFVLPFLLDFFEVFSSLCRPILCVCVCVSFFSIPAYSPNSTKKKHSPHPPTFFSTSFTASPFPPPSYTPRRAPTSQLTKCYNEIPYKTNRVAKTKTNTKQTNFQTPPSYTPFPSSLFSFFFSKIFQKWRSEE